MCQLPDSPQERPEVCTPPKNETARAVGVAGDGWVI